jgi:regulatory protein
VTGRRAQRSIAERRAARADVDDPDIVLNAALRFLEARPRSVAEVRRRLTSAGYRAALVEGAVDRLAVLGILDDEAFARAWIESRDRARPRGEIALRRELAVKGVPRETVDAAIRERNHGADAAAADRPAAGVEAERDRAERLLARHARALEREPDPRRRRQRAYALLARNGFAPDVASDLSRTWGEDAIE